MRRHRQVKVTAIGGQALTAKYAWGTLTGNRTAIASGRILVRDVFHRMAETWRRYECARPDTGAAGGGRREPSAAGKAFVKRSSHMSRFCRSGTPTHHQTADGQRATLVGDVVCRLRLPERCARRQSHRYREPVSPCRPHCHTSGRWPASHAMARLCVDGRGAHWPVARVRGRGLT